jgi:RNA polymerase sigma-70 factor (ECF subfamily)
MNAPSDVEPIDQLRAGDRVALGLIYDRHVRAVFRYALTELRSNEDAEDVTQETFITLFQRARTIHLVDQSALPWLLVTSRNHARNKQRARTRELSRSAPMREIQSSAHPSAQPEANALASELQQALEQAVSELSNIDRRLFELCIRGDASYAAAAKALGVSHGTVRNRLFRIRPRLQRALALVKEVQQ